MKQEKKTEKKYADDDGRTIADMSAEWMPWNHGWFRIKPRRRKHDAEVKMTKKEKRALMKGAFSAMLPMLLTITGVFLLMFLLAFIWLMP